MKIDDYYRHIAVLGVSLLTMACGCSSLPRHDCESCSGNSKSKPAKTLFSWAVGPDEEDKADDKKKDEAEAKNGQADNAAKEKNGKDAKEDEKSEKKNGNSADATSTNGNDEEAVAPKPIETDRPDFTEASSTVGRGRIQLESGYTYSRDRANGVKASAHSYPEILLRIGLFADWFELRLGQNFGNSRSLAPAFVENLAGGEDTYLGVKLALTEQKKYLPETALILQATVPTGHRDFTADQMLPGLNYLFGWDVIDDCLSCAGSLQANRAIDDVGHYYAEVAQSFTVGYSLTKKLGAYTEWFAFYPAGSISLEVGPQHYFDGGFTYKVTDNFQLDIRAGVGLNRYADDFFAGTGFAVRY